MLSILLVLCWLYSTGVQWAGVLAQPAQHAERQVGHISPPIPSDPSPLIGVILTSSSASPTTSSTSSSTTSSHVMTSTGSALAPSSTPTLFSINAVKNMTTCTPGIITWTYNGSSANILLSITNVNVLDPYPQRDLARRQNTAGQSVSVTLANISATSNSWTWSQVIQPQGWYTIQGSVASLKASSAAFFISNGSDTACLLSSPSSSTGPTSTASPIVVETYSTKPSAGEIAGIVVGSLAGLVILALAIAYYLRRRRRPAIRSGKPKPKVQNVGRWSSLKSNDSAARSLAEGNAGFTHSHGHSESTGEILVVAESGKASETTTPHGSDEYHGEEKVVHTPSPTAMIPLDAIDTPLSRHDRRVSAYSLQDPSFRGDAGRTRVTSRDSKQGLELQAARIRSSMETSMYMRTERFSLPAIAAPIPRTPTSPSRGRDEYPPSPVAASLRRSPSAGAASARRTSRKPVPHYDASEFRDELRSAADNQSTITAGESSHSHGTESLPPLHGMSGLPNNRIHYLIPDMPPSGNE